METLTGVHQVIADFALDNGVSLGLDWDMALWACEVWPELGALALSQNLGSSSPISSKALTFAHPGICALSVVRSRRSHRGHGCLVGGDTALRSRRKGFMRSASYYYRGSMAYTRSRRRRDTFWRSYSGFVWDTS